MGWQKVLRTETKNVDFPLEPQSPCVPAVEPTEYPVTASHERQPALRARESHQPLRHWNSCGLFRPLSRSSHITRRPGTNKQAASVGHAQDTSLENGL